MRGQASFNARAKKESDKIAELLVDAGEFEIIQEKIGECNCRKEARGAYGHTEDCDYVSSRVKLRWGTKIRAPEEYIMKVW